MMNSKRPLKKQARDREIADLARDRHKAREARLARVKQEKRARLAARKQALRDKAEQRSKVDAAIARAGGGEPDPETRSGNTGDGAS